MAKVDNKDVKEKCNVMNDAWVEGAPTVDFNGITQALFQAEITAAAADDAAIGDLVGLGVAGSAGFVRKSDRAFGVDAKGEVAGA